MHCTQLCPAFIGEIFTDLARENLTDHLCLSQKRNSVWTLKLDELGEKKKKQQQQYFGGIQSSTKEQNRFQFLFR